MSQLWQLKNLLTGEALSPAQGLPENWGPIFGLAGIQDRLGDLSWLGEAYANQGWVQVDAQPPAEATREEKIAHVAAQIAQRISESDPMVAADKVLQRSILSSSPEEITFLKRVLVTSGKDGQQAWCARPCFETAAVRPPQHEVLL